MLERVLDEGTSRDQCQRELSIRPGVLLAGCIVAVLLMTGACFTCTTYSLDWLPTRIYNKRPAGLSDQRWIYDIQMHSILASRLHWYFHLLPANH